MSKTPDGWADILEPGETIVWQGRPRASIRWRDLISVQTVMGVFFIVFTTVWLKGAIWMGGSMPGGAGDMLIIFKLFGAVFLAVGVYMALGRLFVDAFVRARTWYTLSDRAAYIATDVFGQRKLKRYSGADMVEPRLEDGTPGAVWFASETRTYTSGSRSRNGLRSTRRTHSYQVPIGFASIDDPRPVFRMVNELRTKAQRAHD